MEGVLVLELEENSPLAKAGIQKSDVIVGCQSVDIKELKDLQLVLKRDQYMNKLNIEVFRNQEKKTMQVNL